MRLVRHGMFKAQFHRVQCESWGVAEIRDWRFTELTAVLHVSTDRMPGFGKVNPNLVGASGFETALKF